MEALGRYNRLMSDADFKLIFTHKEMVRDLLQGFVQGDWIEGADFDSLELCESELIAETDQPITRYGDLIWRIRVGENWVYLFLLLEFQSSPDRWMALRMLVYSSLLWQALVRRGELAPGRTLPPVLPVVLYNGETRWRAPTDLSGLCYPAPEELQAFQPRMRYKLLEERVLAAHTTGTGNLAAALFRLDSSPDLADMASVFAELGVWLRESASEELKASLNAYFARWTRARATMDDPQDIDLFGEGNMSFAQRAEQWREDFISEGKRQALTLQLEHRFGKLSETQAQQIAQATAEQLDTWTLRIVDAVSIDSVFRDT